MRDYWCYKPRELRNKKVSLNKGDVILTSEPFAHVVENDRRGQYCDYCLMSNRYKSLHPCKGCGFNFYCSDGCMQQSWDEVHRRECPNLKRCRAKEGEAIPNYARLLARIIFRLQEGGEKFEEKYCNNQGRKFKDLMNHYKDIKNDPVRMRDVHKMMKILTDYIGEENVPNESDFIGIYGRALVNRFCLNDELNVPMGSAVYLAASIFDHACLPNAHPSFIGKKLSVRTLVDLPELNLDKVRISYIDCVNNREMRRQELFRNWYFWCDCDLCCNEEREHYENFIECENPLCSSQVRVPERYSKLDSIEDNRKFTDEDSATALKRALEATKIQFKFASVPVNPFASIDACMSYIFYDKDRYQPASDSDLETDDSSSEMTPPRQKSPEPVRETLKENDAPTNGCLDVEEAENALTNAINPPITNGSVEGFPASEETTSEKKNVSSRGVKSQAQANGFHIKENTQEKSMQPIANSNGIKKSSLKKSSVTKSVIEEILNKNTGAKPKTLANRRKSVNSVDQDTKNTDEIKLSNGTLKHEVIQLNGASENLPEAIITNGHSSIEDVNKSKEILQKAVDSEQPKKKKKRKKVPVYEQSEVMCGDCKCYLDKNTLREYRSAVGFTIQRLKDMKEDSPNFQVVLDVLDRQGTIVPKLNVWKVRTLDFAFNATFYGGAWVLALKYGMENLDGMKLFYGEEHPSLGLYYMKLGKVHLCLKLYRPGLQLVKKAKAILTVAMGPKHPFITGQLSDLEMMANEDPEIYMESRLQKQRENITEIVCPCCGKKKIIRRVETVAKPDRPWEQDIKYNQQQQVDSEFFSSSDFVKY